MNNQILLTEPGPVLDEKGRPYPGYSTASVRSYSRSQIKAPVMRIKEWDWYQVNNDHLCLQFTYGHASYVGQAGIMMFDFRSGEKIIDTSELIPLALDRMRLPENADKTNVIEYNSKKLKMRIASFGDVRRLTFECEEGHGEVVLKRKNPHALVITVPFKEKPTQFYYNHKINCMTAEGSVVWNDKVYTFEEKDSFGLLDWGRGVWPFHNEWYWSNATGYVDGKMVGFNLGCGFGDPYAATENIVFHDGTYSKYGNVTFECNHEDYDQPWHLKDEDGRIDLTLVPVYDRLTAIKAAWVDNCTHQMFGSFIGTIRLDNGEVLTLKEGDLVSFAEYAVNNW